MKNSYVKLVKLDYFLFFIFCIYPILNNSYSLWDGSIISNALDTEQFDIIKTWFFEAGLPTVVPMIYLCQLLQQVTGIYSNTILMIVISFFSFALYWIILKIIDHFVHTSKSDKVFIAIIFSLLPFWGVFLSSVFIHWVVPVFICFLAIYLLLKEKYIFSFILAFISFDLKINFFLSISIMVFFIFQFNEHFNKVQLKKIIIYFILALILFALKNYIITPYGVYSGYNAINMHKFTEFFLDYNVFKKLIFFCPIFIFSMLMFKRNAFIFFVLFFIGFMGVFYLAGKFFPISGYSFYRTYSYDIRFDMHLFIYTFICCTVVGIKNKRIITLLLFILYLPVRIGNLRYVSQEIDNIKIIYKALSNSKFSNENVLVTLDNPRFYESNYHLQRASHYKAIIDKSSLGRPSLRFESPSAVYKRAYMVNDINSCNIKNITIHNDGKPSILALWF